MDGHQLIGRALEVIGEIWSPNISFGIYSISLVVFSAALSSLLCGKKGNDDENENEDEITFRLTSNEHNIGSVSSVLSELLENVENTNKQFTLRLNMQGAEQEEIRKSVKILEDKYNKIEDFLEGSSE